MAFLALQGGGVRAFASDAGVLAGLACAANKSVAELAGAFEAPGGAGRGGLGGWGGWGVGGMG